MLVVFFFFFNFFWLPMFPFHTFLYSMIATINSEWSWFNKWDLIQASSVVKYAEGTPSLCDGKDYLKCKPENSLATAIEILLLPAIIWAAFLRTLWRK